MRRYAVYGACLASDVAFPELPPAGAEPEKWRFRVVRALPPMRGARELGAERIYGDVHARLHAHDEGHRIHVDDTGSFDLSADRRTIAWEERAASWPDFVRAHCLGRVLATAMHLDGWLPLHASAVATPEGVIAFLAPKGYGKSSLALALAADGFPVVTDDLLPVEPASPRVRAWPGVRSVRARDDALAQLGLDAGGEATREGKRVIAPAAPAPATDGPAPLAALYLLAPVGPGDGAAATRVALPETLAAISVVAHAKVGGMLGPSAAGELLARTAEVVRRVPVHRLHAVRDLARLPEVARMVRAWHGGA